MPVAGMRRGSVNIWYFILFLDMSGYLQRTWIPNNLVLGLCTFLQRKVAQERCVFKDLCFGSVLRAGNSKFACHIMSKILCEREVCLTLSAYGCTTTRKGNPHSKSSRKVAKIFLPWYTPLSFEDVFYSFRWPWVFVGKSELTFISCYLGRKKSKTKEETGSI